MSRDSAGNFWENTGRGWERIMSSQQSQNPLRKISESSQLSSGALVKAAPMGAALPNASVTIPNYFKYLSAKFMYCSQSQGVMLCPPLRTW